MPVCLATAAWNCTKEIALRADDFEWKRCIQIDEYERSLFSIVSLFLLLFSPFKSSNYS